MPTLPDPSMSPDPVIRRVSRRRDILRRELDALAALIGTYTSCIQVRDGRPSMSLLEHYSMLDAPECGCVTCMEWELRRSEFVEALPFVPKGHKWTICACPDCRFVGRIQLNYLAAANRRDLLIEMSFHARHHSTHGRLVMAWMEKELTNPAYTVNWCAQEMSRFPVERWIKRCEMAVSGVVSGAVFVAAAGRMDFTVHTASSLGDDIGVAGW